MSKASTLISLQCRPHFSSENGPMRVWRTDWQGDQFEILSKEEFASLKANLARFNIDIEHMED